MIKHGSLLKYRNGLCMLEGYRHSLLIIRYKHQRYQGGLLMQTIVTCTQEVKKKSKQGWRQS